MILHQVHETICGDRSGMKGFRDLKRFSCQTDGHFGLLLYQARLPGDARASVDPAVRMYDSAQSQEGNGFWPTSHHVMCTKAAGVCSDDGRNSRYDCIVSGMS